MKKRIFTFALCLVLIITNCICALAQASLSNEYTMEELSYSVAYSEFQRMMIDVNIDNYNAYFSHESYNGLRDCYRIRLVSKNDILVRTDAGNGDYYYTVYYYDGSKMQIGYSPYQFTITDGYQYIDNQVLNQWGASNGSDANYRYMLKGVPIANSVENALLYYQTMDYSYLENADDFIQVPRLKTVSMYYASEENALYVYFENNKSDLSELLCTRLSGAYYYCGASGIDEKIADISNIDVPFTERGQIKIDLSAIDNYDTGKVKLNIYNNYNNLIDSEGYLIEWNKNSNSYYIGEYFGGEISTDADVPIVDYKTKNDSYTGGNRNNISSVPSVGQGDYSFLGGIFNGFGLLGNNGLIALLGNTFSYLPVDIFTLLALGVSAMLVIALFKLLVD